MMRRFLRERITAKTDYRLGYGKRRRAYLGVVRVPWFLVEWSWKV